MNDAKKTFSVKDGKGSFYQTFQIHPDTMFTNFQKMMDVYGCSEMSKGQKMPEVFPEFLEFRSRVPPWPNAVGSADELAGWRLLQPSHHQLQGQLHGPTNDSDLKRREHMGNTWVIECHIFAAKEPGSEQMIFHGFH